MTGKKLITIGLTAAFALTSITTPVFASSGKGSVKVNNGKANIKISAQKTNPSSNGKGNGNGKSVETAKPKDNNNTQQFADSGEVSWATKSIEKMKAKGILNGKDSKNFKPKENITKIEVLAMLIKLTGYQDEAAQSSGTVNPDYTGEKSSWGQGYINIAIEKGILLKDELSGFKPNVPAKRYEVAKYVVRALGKTEDALKNMNAELTYKDKDAIPKDSIGYVYMAAQLNLMKGSDSNEFQPMKPITRAEMAVLIDRADGSNDAPDVDKNEAKTEFVSVDETTNKLTVKTADGKTVVYDMVPNVPVYINSAYSNVKALKAGDRLSIIFNEAKQVIFIEVVPYTAPVTPEKLTTAAAVYSELDPQLQSLVDALKLTTSYKAIKLGDSIYFIAARGTMNTGGYSIEIKEVSRTLQSNGKYAIKAVVSTKDPAKDEVVTQALTYPYYIAKTAYIANIETITFTDETGKVIAQTTLTEMTKSTTSAQ